MGTTQSVVLVIHTFIAVMIIVLVLFQRGKGAEAGAAFGAGASGTVFGARGSGSFFSRVTAILAAAFFASSLTLAYMSSQRSSAPESLIEEAAPVEIEQKATEEAVPLPELPALEEDETGEAGDDLPALPEDEPADTTEETAQ